MAAGLSRSQSALDKLLEEISACRFCEKELPLEPRPVVRASSSARLLIVGQAPGIRVHESGIPWNDPSGDRLRAWLGMTREYFYDEKCIAIVPMGFCYPGKGTAGDLPPRAECARLWRDKLLAQLPDIELTLVIGQYAQQYHLGSKGQTVTETVKAWRSYLPEYLPAPHPSPRNLRWLKRNAWFENDVLPELRRRVRKLFPDLPEQQQG